VHQLPAENVRRFNYLPVQVATFRHEPLIIYPRLSMVYTGAGWSDDKLVRSDAQNGFVCFEALCILVSAAQLKL